MGNKGFIIAVILIAVIIILFILGIFEKYTSAKWLKDSKRGDNIK